MDAQQTTTESRNIEGPVEHSETAIADTVNGVLDARDRWVQAANEFNEISTASIDALKGIDPDTITDTELRTRFNEVRLLTRGPGGA